MKVLDRFSLQDFVAYFFPGVIGGIGIIWILMLTPLDAKISAIKLDISSVSILLVVAYVLGMVLSGISVPIAKWVISKIKIKTELSEILPEAIIERIELALKTINKTKVDLKTTNREAYYYYCSNLVLHYMPEVAKNIERQNSLRQFRANMLAPILILMIAGIVWGIYYVSNGAYFWGSMMVSLTMIFSIVSSITLVKRSENNYVNQQRDIWLGFLAGYDSCLFFGVIDPADKK